MTEAKRMSHILVVEDSRTQATEIQMLLEGSGFSVAVAGDGRIALNALALARADGATAPFPDAVLTDLEMPEVNGLELVEAVRQDYPSLPVVLMTAQGSEEIAVRALQQGAASYVPKRNLECDIAETLNKVLTVARAGRDQRRLLECLTRTEVCFTLENDPGLVTTLLGHLENQADCLALHDRTERLRVGVALHEALLNAIYHGNLEVSSELRQEDESAFHDLAQARRSQSPYRDRRIHVRACLDRKEAVYIIEDQGPGFDPKTLPDPTNPENIGRVGGRGLMLIRTFMDHVEHNAAGNLITMVKKMKQRSS
jgi:CheY-like chemotaxis protein